MAFNSERLVYLSCVCCSVVQLLPCQVCEISLKISHPKHDTAVFWGRFSQSEPEKMIALNGHVPRIV